MDLSIWITFSIISFLWNIKTNVNSEGYKTDGNVERVLVNSTAQIKCDVSSNLPNDQVLLVVWYKNNLPIYSYDTRGPHAGTPSHWKDDEVLENRAVFRAVREPAELFINPVLEKDAGNFRCRVDFKLSPTRNSNVDLEIVVPPQTPKIFNDRSEHIESRAGPFEEGSDLHLVCVVTGGTPAPTVTWSNNGQILSSQLLDFSFPSTLNSKLVVKNLSRIHQHAVYTCQASNFHKKSVTTNVTIELYLRPLEVEILFANQPLSADRKYEIQCDAYGSRPPAKITWWMGGELTGHQQKVSSDGNVSTSILIFTPTRQDHGKVLTCRATNELVKRGIKETSMKLNVFFLPTIQLELGSNLNPEDIEEGDDVYFECKVQANPTAYKVIWKHNGQVVQHNQKNGIIMSSGDLALQGVTRHLAGNYTCIASNVEGDGESNTVHLKVMYKPLCRQDQKRIYGVGRNEAAEVVCEVDSFPPPESFKWSFNNTAETFDMPQNGYRIHEQTSTLSYTPVKEMDFGTIMCWADNLVGQQKEPCVFHLIAAGKPDMPYNCTLVNQTSESLEVDCSEGFDGGQRQWFIMEIFDQITGILQANVSSKLPIFTVSGLDAGKLLKIIIYAANVKGKSDSVLLEGFTLKAAEKQTGVHNQFELTPILSIGIFIGILTALICIIIAVVAAIKLRTTTDKQQQQQHQQQQQQQQNNKSNLLKRPGNLPIKEKISLPLSQSEDMYDEKNPDVVPSNEDPDYKLKSANQTPSSALHNTICNNHDIMGRTIVDDTRKAYITGPTGEVHYAELSLTIPRDDSKTHINHLLKKPPPPAYNYFDEPTIYAQIDHCTNNLKAGSISPYPPLISPSSALLIDSNSMLHLQQQQLHLQQQHLQQQQQQQHQHQQQQQHQQPQLQLLSNHPHSHSLQPQYNTLPHPLSHQSNYSHNSHLSHHNINSINNNINNSNSLLHHSTAGVIQQPLALSGAGMGGAGVGVVGVGAGMATASTISTPTTTDTKNLLSNNNNNSNLNNNNSNNNNNNNKQYLREIVTVRTPLAFSQQESCV